MIVANVARGSSFKGVTAYLANPRDDQHRADWTATRNVATSNVHMAARFMAATAMDADAIKLANGWNGKGRKSTDQPVYHTIMSWDESRHPDALHQERAAQELLAAMGFERAQAIMVGHSDNGKTHLHLVVNLIDPDTGKQFSLSNDQRKMQAWALDYCKANGIELDEIAPNRAKNAEARAKGAPAAELEGNKRLSREEWQTMRDTLFARHAEERAELKAVHGADWQQAKGEIAAKQRADEAAWRSEFAKQKARIKSEAKPEWRALFKRQRSESFAADLQIARAASADRRARSLTGAALRVFGLGQSVDQAEHNLRAAQLDKAALLDRQEIERREKAQAQGRAAIEATKSALPSRDALDLGPMKEGHAEDWQALRDRQQAEREAAGIKWEPKRQPDRQAEQRETARKERLTQRETPHEQAGRYGIELDPKEREALRRMRERERQERERDKDRDRKR